MPAAYVIAQISVTDPEIFEEYRAQVPATFEIYGGEYVVRGGAMEILEGDSKYSRIVVIKFPSMAKAKAWHRSVEYATPLALRQAASIGLLVSVEGLE
ncbi:MAG: DUF1330 domain-containing protein [Proteobacteria bacterium]|nr:DUF1330 domain-containing protein [Pseudomonadota bacterium]